MLTIKCPKCATLLKVKPQNSDFQVKCPKCATLLKVVAQKTSQISTANSETKAASQTAAKRTAAQKNPGNKTPQPKRQKPVAKKPPATGAAAQKAAPKTKKQPPAKVPSVPVDPDNPFGDLPDANLPDANFPDANVPDLGIPGFDSADLGVPGIPGGLPAGDLDPFDFGGVDLPAAPVAGGGFPAAPTSFPAAPAANPYAKKPSAKKKGDTNSEPAKARKSGKKSKTKKKDKPKSQSDSSSQKMLWIGLAIGASVLLLGGVATFFLMGSSDSQPSSSVAAAAPAPDGYQSGSVGRVSFAFPQGTPKEAPPTTTEAQALVSAESGATFFVGVDEYEFLNPSEYQVSLRAGRMILSNVYGREQVKRSGHSGVKGQSSGGLTLTNMTVEYYFVDGEVILIGCGMPKKEKPKQKLPYNPNKKPEPPPEPTDDEKAKDAAFEKEKIAFFDSVQI